MKIRFTQTELNFLETVAQSLLADRIAQIRAGMSPEEALDLCNKVVALAHGLTSQDDDE